MNKKIFTLFLAVTMLFMVSCNRDGEATDFGFTDPNTGIDYYYVEPMGLYPVDAGEEYITVDGNGEEMVFYQVEFESPNRFLCFKDSGNYFLVRASTVKEPKVYEFNPIAASIYGSTNTTYITSFFADDKYLSEEDRGQNPTQDTWLCQLIANHIRDDENVSLPLNEYNITDLYYIRLYSEDYPGLYYLISFFGYNGRYFLRDDSIDKTVYCPYDVIERMVSGYENLPDIDVSGESDL